MDAKRCGDAVRCGPEPAIENHLLVLSKGVVEEAYPLHGGIEVGEVGSSVPPRVCREDHAKWDLMLLEESTQRLQVGGYAALIEPPSPLQHVDVQMKERWGSPSRLERPNPGLQLRHREVGVGLRVTHDDVRVCSLHQPHRSEERRVGKEWRSRWSPD